MYGVGLGILVGVVLGWAEVASWWWILWSAIIGGVLELFVRLGAGEELGEAVSNCVTAGIEISNTGVTSGDYSVGDGYSSAGGATDYGGGDCGGGGNF